ncbi:uncharacterized protein LOC115209534 [Octopus sinensis]|uniref:Uncharacterized protein LOC115209534 n=1 Tax=Octopus sinensis TaxID=2607531 RepID=A0A6P7S6K9_9MOLL|nr:uncharacterized protein LOC115209534 [Octopus sinensis]
MGLTAEKDAKVRTRIFAKLEQNQDVTLQQVSDECERIVKLRHNTEKIEHKEHTTTVPYHPRSNGQVEHFVDIFKRALRKSNKEVTDEVTLLQFLRVYQVTPNLNTPGANSPAELMFARKVKSVFDKLLPGKKRKSARDDIAKLFKVVGKVYMRAYKNGKQI